jgi:hypothetical protein
LDQIPTDVNQADRYVAYNSYTISTATINQGFGGVFIGLSNTARAGYTNLDVDADNLAHIALQQREDVGLPYRGWRILMPIACNGLHVDDELTTAPQCDEAAEPRIAASRGGSINAVHMLSESGSGCGDNLLWYWRNVGGAWTGPVMIDVTPTTGYVIADDPNSNKVAIVLHTSAEPQFNGNNNIAYYQSSTAGTDWLSGVPGTKHFLTNYTDPCGPQAWLHISTTYDNSGTLHVAWDEQRYANATADVAIRHWNSNRNTIRPVTFGYYPSPQSIGAFDLNLSKLTMGIGDGSSTCSSGAGDEPNNNYVYILYTKFGGPSATEQADYSANGFYNGELYLTVSNTGGNTWSPPANLTNTKTPGCDPGPADPQTGLPANPDLVCRSEHWATIGRTVSDVDVTFISDVDAGGIPYGEGTWQMNPVMYLRLPKGTHAQYVCPVIAPLFQAIVSSKCEYHSSRTGSDVESLTILNLGAATLNGSISLTDFPGPPTLSLSGGGGAYSITGGSPDIVKSVTMAANNALPGVYHGSISITHNDVTQSSPFVIPIDFRVVEDSLYQPCPPCSTLISGPCPGSLVQNGSFVDGAVAGTMPSPGASSHWSKAYGSPTVSTNFGCGDQTFVRLDGNKTSGAAIYQQLGSPLQAGHLYELRMCVRVDPSSSVNHARFRAMAFNGTLPTGGTHPAPTSNIALIDVSGTITSNDWTTYTFQRWPANYNFSNIAIAVDNSDTLSHSIADIDNVCLVETDTLPCYLVATDSLGNVIYPGSLDPDNPPVVEDIDNLTGNINDIYAPCNPGGMDIWYEGCPDSCASIGGTIPQSVQDDIINFNLQDSLTALGINEPAQEIYDSLQTLETTLQTYAGNLLDTLISLGALPSCDSLPPMGPPPNFTNSPFQGMDIVFVHGLRADALCDKLNGVPGAQTKWPQDQGEFYDDGDGGYWKRGAEAYWRDHIRRYLGVDPDPAHFPMPGNGYMNRFIVVAHPATQSGIRAVHAIQAQIYQAMLYGRDVRKCNPADSRPLNTFGQNGFLIISHSDGALFSNVAMKVAKLTGTNPVLGMLLGDASAIADRCKLHVALNGAFMGSNYATLTLLALSSPPLVALAGALLDNCDPTGHPWLFTSQLLDMAIAKYMYGGLLFQKLCGVLPYPINLPFCLLGNEDLMEPPMCVLTVSGGNPSEYGVYGGPPPHNTLLQVAAKHLVHHGFDDGIVSSDCACGNSDRRIYYPNRYLASPGLLTVLGLATLGPLGGLLNERVYDMGIKPERAAGYYMDQKLDILTAELMLNLVPPQDRPAWWSPGNQFYNFQLTSAGCVPWLSPTGMVQPVLLSRLPGQSGHDALKRIGNHYSFIQSAADHYSGATDVSNTSPFPDYYTSFGRRNWEEVRVVTSNDVYTKCGVSGQIANMQEEHIRGKKITFSFKLFGKRWSHSFWIWKRKYHFLNGSGDSGGGKNQLDYVYGYVLKP